MAEDSGKKIIFGFDVNGPDFQNTIDKIRALEQAAKGLADTLARANLAGAGGESPITGGVATPRPMGGGDLGGVAGGTGGRYNGPLLVRTAEINRNLKDFIPVLKEYAAEYTRLLTALSAPLPAGTSAADLLTAIASGGGARGVAGGRASSEGTVAPPTEGGGRRRRGIWYEREGVLDYREYGEDEGTPPPPRAPRPPSRGGDGDGGGGGRGGFAGGGGRDLTYRDMLQVNRNLGDMAKGVVNTFGAVNEFAQKAAFIPVQGQVGQASWDAYVRSKTLSGDMTFAVMLDDLYKSSVAGGTAVTGDRAATLAKHYGLLKESRVGLGLEKMSGYKQIGEGGAGLFASIVNMFLGRGGSTGGGGGGGAGGGSTGGGGTVGGGTSYVELASGSTSSLSGMMAGKNRVDIAQMMIDAGMPEATKQQNMIRYLDMIQGLPAYQDVQLFQQSKVQMIDMQRSLGRVASSTGGTVSGEKAYNLAKALGLRYGISAQDTAGFAGMAGHRRETANESEYRAVVDSYMRMSTAGYGQGSMGGLSDIASLLQVNRMGGGGRGQSYAGQELDILSKFSGSIGVQEAGIEAAQAGMMGFGGIASQQGMETYAQMLTSGAVNAQNVKIRGSGMSALGQMSQLPLVQAMTLAKLKTDSLTKGRLDPSQQQVIMSMSFAEKADVEKLANIIDPFKKITGDRLGRVRRLSDELLATQTDTIGSQVVGRRTELGQEITRVGSLTKVIEALYGKTDDYSQGLLTQAATAFANVGGQGMATAQAEMELIGARRQPAVARPTPSEAADTRMVNDYRVTLAAQQESLYAGMNNALTSMGQTFSNASAEIDNIISQLANNTTSNIGGMKVVGTIPQ